MPRGRYGESAVISRDEIDATQILAADQVLVGRNETRRKYNGRIRTLLNRRDLVPELEEKSGLPAQQPAKGL